MKIGLIGTGEMARTHVRAWRTLDAEVVIHSRSKERGATFAAEHGLGSETDMTTLLDSVDVVDICTPTNSHPALVIAAANAGRDVICEKPLALSLEQAGEMVAACESACVRLLVGHTLRYFPAYAIARDRVLAGDLGELRGLRLERIGEFPPWGTWFADAEQSGGVLVDLAIHDLDFARWTAGEVHAVTAEGGQSSELPIEGNAVLEHAHGVRSTVTAVWGKPGLPFRPRFEIVGDKGSLRFDSLPMPVLFDGDGEKIWEDDGVDPYATQLADFVAVLQGGREPLVTVDDGIAALRIALAASESARQSSQRVEL